jgi:hypothetical protein
VRDEASHRIKKEKNIQQTVQTRKGAFWNTLLKESLKEG